MGGDIWSELTCGTCPQFSLIGKIGTGGPFYVGEQARFISPLDGQLYLGFNDLPVDDPNNNGYFVAIIYINEQTNSIVQSPPIFSTLMPSLSQNYPNPFNPDTNIEYAIPKDSHMTLKIYNSKGELVTTLVDGKVKAGSYTVKWNGKDDNGKTVSSGVYFYQIQAEGYNSTKKMITIK